jgi:glycosyltransferase involved in cell wall biosynthesis
MSGKLRILHVTPSIAGYGAERLIVEMLKHLPCSDVDPALLAVYAPPDGTPAPDLPFPVRFVGRKGRADRMFLGRMVREIRRFDPHVVHTHTHVGRYWGRLAAVLAGVRFIVHTEHNPCDFRRTRLERVIDRLLASRTARVITFFSEQASSLGEFERLPAGKMAVIPNALTPPDESDSDRASLRGSLGLGPADVAIALIGRMEFQKNHRLALEAFAALRPAVRDTIMLFLIGSGNEDLALRERTRELGIAERVRFLGFRSDVHELLTVMDVVLMTSWFEGMPLALIEAMMAGVPIVTTPWTGARNMLGDGRFGFIAAGFAPQDVASEIERAVERPQMRRQAAQRAFAYARDAFAMPRMIEAHRALYRQLVAAAP